MRKRRVAVTFAIALTIMSRVAYGDPSPAVNLHMRTASHVVTDGGSKLDLPPGYYMDEPSHDKLELETKRLQDSETRLKAENTSMRASLAGWQPGFYTLLTVVVGGVALGAYLQHAL